MKEEESDRLVQVLFQILASVLSAYGGAWLALNFTDQLNVQRGGTILFGFLLILALTIIFGLAFIFRKKLWKN